MSDLPKFVEFHEEGPREGFQSEPKVYTVAERAAVVDALSETGLTQIQVASFVNPKAVPQMANVPELFAAIKHKPGVRYTALWLNKRGFEQAAETPGVDLDGKLIFYTTDGLCQHNNNCSAMEMRNKQVEWIKIYDHYNVSIEQAYILCSFGCNFEGAVPVKAVTDLVHFIKDVFDEAGQPAPRIYLADTVGWANPEDLKRRIGAMREIVPDMRLGLHLHDTRGLGGANFYAALQMGIDLFDSSVAGLGGCPFANHGDLSAAGNICTEDMVYLCHELGIETGIDLDKLLEAAHVAERVIGRRLNGRLLRNGSLDKFRKKAS